MFLKRTTINMTSHPCDEFLKRACDHPLIWKSHHFVLGAATRGHTTNNSWVVEVLEVIWGGFMCKSHSLISS
jgi:hypothetical protein